MMTSAYIYSKKPKFDEKEDIYETRSEIEFSASAVEAMSIITSDSKTLPVGSYRWKLHRYPVDIDFMEILSSCCSPTESATKAAIQIQKIAYKVKSTKSVYWGYLKAGIDYELYPSEGMNIEQYFSVSGKYLSEDEKDFIREDYPNNTRVHYMIRWTLDEVIKGSKIIKSGYLMNLRDALQTQSTVKIDLWMQINGNFKTVSNFFIIFWTDKEGNKYYINYNFNNHIISLKKDIIKFYHKGMYLKTLKRIWSLNVFDRNVSNDIILRQIVFIFSSIAAKLDQNLGELVTIRKMLIELHNPPIDSFIEQINGFKRRLNVSTYNLINKIIQKLDNITINLTRNEFLKAIDSLKLIEIKLSKIINKIAFYNVYLRGFDLDKYVINLMFNNNTTIKRHIY